MCKCNEKPTLIRLPDGRLAKEVLEIGNIICNQKGELQFHVITAWQWGYDSNINIEYFTYITKQEAEKAYNEFISKFEVI